MATGHMIPIVDTAKQFARHDTVTVKATIILSNLNEPLFRDTIERERQLGFDISIRQVTFPSEQVGLPEDFSGNLSSITSPDMCLKLDDAIYLLKQPIEDMLKQDMPDCIVSDLFIPWAADVAAKLRIPNIIFHVVGFFPLSVHHSLIKHKPYDGIESDSDLFVVPGLPHAVKLTKGQLPDSFISRGHEPEDQMVATKIMENARQNEIASYGAVFNSFEEMEPGYAEHYKANIARKAWHFGPVSLCNKDSIIDKAQRGGMNMNIVIIWTGLAPKNQTRWSTFLSGHCRRSRLLNY
ncbi:hypothetical protein DH2020_023919 [Rehmannia glutinosa]|uniref:Uncharacterized protein n=1 Tax=Rehmannia glutinosa TaxID=99300 RepID=A0ABR0W7D7_REHGL